MGKITAASVTKYCLLPGIVPRMRSIFFSGFKTLAFYIALIYRGVRLLPAGHRFLNERNIGTFGVLSVVREASQNIDYKWKNIDQIVIFYTVLSGILLTFLYVGMAIAFIVVGPAMAANLFSNPDPSNDIAFMMMDRTFGIPDMFNSKFAQSVPLPTPFHRGMHALFAFFSYGMMFVAVIILFYYLVEIVFETAVTGVPFGKRFENAFVPIRIVMAIGMLIPMAYGFNSLQWITLYVAKFGSNLATNAWIAYNNEMGNPMGLSNAELIAKPVVPEASGFIRDLLIMRSCIDLENMLYKADNAAAQSTASNNAAAQPASAGEPAATASIPVAANQPPPVAANGNEVEVIVVTGRRRKPSLIQPYIIAPNGKAISLHNGAGSYLKDYDGFYYMFEKALKKSPTGSIKIIAGRYSEASELSGEYPGGVQPTCGVVNIPVGFNVEGTLSEAEAEKDRNIRDELVNERLVVSEGYFYTTMRVLFGFGRRVGDEGSGEENPETKRLDDLLSAASRRQIVLSSNLRQFYNSKYNVPTEDPCPFSEDDEMDESVSGYASLEDLRSLGKCDTPIPNNFWKKILKEQENYVLFATAAGYEFFTNNVKNFLYTEQKQRLKIYNACKAAGRSEADCLSKSNLATTNIGTADQNDLYKSYTDFSFYGNVSWSELGAPDPLSMEIKDKINMIRYGWGGAGFWYRVVAEKNGALSDAINTLPTVAKFPLILEEIKEEKLAKDKNLSGAGCERFNPQTATEGIASGSSKDLAEIYYKMCDNFTNNEALKPDNAYGAESPNFVLNLINMMFGTKSLFSFRENVDVHPLAQMSSLGKALIDKTVNNMLVATGGAAVGGMASAFGSIFSAMGKNKEGRAGGTFTGLGHLGAAAGGVGKAFSGLFVTFAMVGLSAGVLLYYVLPMLPFMHFFFAVARWVKTIFEAMVGMPLWALAHLRMEGAGLPSKASSEGYFLLFEIFARPIITLFALVGAMSAFAASTYILNITWGLVTNNLVGYDPVAQTIGDTASAAYYRPKIDQFFFTIMYIIMVYMVATATFKMIDIIPDEIMKWLSSTKTFGKGDNADDYVDQTSAWIAMPTVQYANQIGGKMVDLVYEVPAGLGQIAGGLVDASEKDKDVKDAEARAAEEARNRAAQQQQRQQQQDQTEQQAQAQREAEARRAREQRATADAQAAAAAQQQQPTQPAAAPANGQPAATAPAANPSAGTTSPVKPTGGGNNGGPP